MDAIEEGIRPLGTARLGVLLRELRESRQLALRDVALLPELRLELEAFEAGRLRPDPAIVAVLLHCYDADLDHLVPPRERLVVTHGTDKEVLTGYLSAVRRWRGRPKHPHLREADLQVLAGILGSDPRDVQRRLQKLTGCSRRRARRLSAMFLAGLAVTPAAGNLLLGRGGPATAPTTSTAALTGTMQGALLRSHQPLLDPTSSVPIHYIDADPKVAGSKAAVPKVAVVPKAASPEVAIVPKAAAPKVAVVPEVAVHTLAADCATALAYLAAHAKPGFAHYCRPGPLNVGVANAVAYTCVPGPRFACPDGNAEIIIADPACAATYENEASNSYWNFSSGAVIQPGATQDGRTWDPDGKCP
jgi:hypothetical protein